MDIGMIEKLTYWNTLSEAERERLKVAAGRYERVQAHNLEREWMRQTEQEREAHARPLGWDRMSLPERERWLHSYRSDPKTFWIEKSSAVAALMSGGLCGKSSLLDRLVCGGRPLTERPPTNHSYPWYCIVESSNAQAIWSVSLGGAMTLGSVARGDGGARRSTHAGAERVVINQTVFIITDANEAGAALLRSAKALLQTPDGTREVEDWSAGARSKKTVPAVTRAHSGWDEVLAAYRAGPEIEVRHGTWPAWKLHLGRRSGCTDARWAREAVEKPPFSQVRDLDPMNVVFGNLDARIVDRDDDALIVEDAVDEEVRRIRNVLDGMPADHTRHQEAMARSASEEQLGRMAYLETSCWHLSKGEGWKALTDEDVYLTV